MADTHVGAGKASGHMKKWYKAEPWFSAEDLKQKQKEWTEKYIKNGKRICGRMLVSCLNLKQVSLDSTKICTLVHKHKGDCFSEAGLPSRSTKTIGEDLSNAKV